MEKDILIKTYNFFKYPDKGEWEALSEKWMNQILVEKGVDFTLKEYSLAFMEKAMRGVQSVILSYIEHPEDF